MAVFKILEKYYDLNIIVQLSITYLLLSSLLRNQIFKKVTFLIHFHLSKS